MKELDYFGETLIKEVRDRSISHWDAVLNGMMGSNESKEYTKRMNQLNPEALSLVKDLIFEVVDTTLFQTLFMFVEKEEQIKLRVDLGNGDVNIVEASDDLHGEIFTEDGWIAKFSEERHRENE